MFISAYQIIDAIQNKFWRKKKLINFVLVPLSCLYYIAYLCDYYLFNKPSKIKIPVICIGNIIVGGSGKTPFAIQLARICMKNNLKVAFVAHGYKANLGSGSCILVDNKKHNHLDVGDEALLLSWIAPTYLSKSRYKAALAAQGNGADVVFLDDGLQDNSIYKDLSFLIINASYGFGNNFMLPVGPLREPARSGMAKIKAVVLSATDQSEISRFQELYPALWKDIQKNKFAIDSITEAENLAEINNASYVVLTGIANPERFISLIKSKAINIINHFIFPDHHCYLEKELEKIYSVAEQNNCLVLTTAKDFVRLPKKYHLKTKVLNIKLNITQKQELEFFLIDCIKKIRKQYI